MPIKSFGSVVIGFVVSLFVLDVNFSIFNIGVCSMALYFGDFYTSPTLLEDHLMEHNPKIPDHGLLGLRPLPTMSMRLVALSRKD